ncbi:MAG TPA: CBS domain-containing protein [Polyangiaceae bacterium]|jgi:CBS domain-containing protein|nr:CBS domain-containing protein [Polyangiaceae bacterium]
MTAARLRLVDEAKKGTAKKGAPTPRTRPRAGARKRACTVADLMRAPAVCCNTGDTLHRAAQLMWEQDVGAVVVVDDAGRPVHMVTDRDVCMGAYTQGLPLWQSRVESLGPRPIASCPLGAGVPEARRLMEQQGVRRMPVVDAAGAVVGLIALGDLVREATAAAPKNRTRGLTPAQLAQTLGAIYEDVGVPSDRLRSH